MLLRSLRQDLTIKMKKIILAIIIASVAVSCNTSDNNKTLSIKGSDTVLPLSQEAIEAYQKENESATISVTGGGSGVGIAALLNGTTDIAQSSRKIKFDEKRKLEEAGKEVVEVILAYDALSVVVHPDNPVSGLSREQMEEIFTGKIKNWKEVGGEDLAIIPYSRETSSGTYEFFKENVLGNKNYMNGILSMPATGGIIQSISQTKGAIGYVGFAYVNESVKSLEVSYDQGQTFISPTVENVKNESYPIVRPLYFYHTDLHEEGKAFIDFILSAEGQQIVSEAGYISIF